MLFVVVYTYRNVTEETEKRSLNLFANWKPPAGYEFKAHYSFADGSGGVSIAEASSAADILEAHAPWGPFLEFRTLPVLEVDKAVPIFLKVQAWRDSVK